MGISASDAGNVAIFKAHHGDNLMLSCWEAQKNRLRLQLSGKGGGPYKTPEDILSYYDHTYFFGKDLRVDKPKNITAALNRGAKSGCLIKLHKGAGSWAYYTFPKSIIKYMIHEIECE